MTPQRFVEAVVAGNIMTGTGGTANGMIADGVQMLGSGDLDAVTAEAYNRGTLPSALPWSEGRREIRRLLNAARAARATHDRTGGQ